MVDDPLDAETLRRLRGVLQAAKDNAGKLPAKAVIGQLAGAVDSPAPVTIDFDATETLGHPLVVVQTAPQPADCFGDLSTREREVAALLAQGLRNKEIAAQLFISVATVKDHVHRVLAKSGLESRAAVAAAWHGADH
jgi:DNA-binding NarL/FixJ family response regulator